MKSCSRPADKDLENSLSFSWEPTKNGTEPNFSGIFCDFRVRFSAKLRRYSLTFCFSYRLCPGSDARIAVWRSHRNVNSTINRYKQSWMQFRGELRLLVRLNGKRFFRWESKSERLQNRALANQMSPTMWMGEFFDK